MNPPSLKPRQVSVVGLGNVFLGDDGFGPLVVEMFRCQYECGANVEVIDLGTPGMDLAPYLYGKDLVLLVDAIHAEKAPGTLCVYREDDLASGQAQLRLTGHDPGVWQSISHLRLVDRAPSEIIIIGIVPVCCEFGKGISDGVRSNSEAAVQTIVQLLLDHHIECRQRQAELTPNLWWLVAEQESLVACS